MKTEQAALKIAEEAKRKIGAKHPHQLPMLSPVPLSPMNQPAHLLQEEKPAENS